MRHTGLPAGIYETALRFRHVFGGGRNHQHAIDTIERRAKCVRPAHIAFDQFDTGKAAEPCHRRPVGIAHQRPHLMLVPRELAHDRFAVQPRGTRH